MDCLNYTGTRARTGTGNRNNNERMKGERVNDRKEGGVLVQALNHTNVPMSARPSAVFMCVYNPYPIDTHVIVNVTVPFA